MGHNSTAHWQGSREIVRDRMSTFKLFCSTVNTYEWLLTLNHSILKAASLGKKNKPVGLYNEDTKTQMRC